MPASVRQSADPILVRLANLINTGNNLLTQGELEAARVHFLAALAIDPNQPVALSNLGAVLRMLRHYPAAAAVTQRSVLLSNGNDPHALSNLAVSYMSMKQFSLARLTAEKALEKLPDAAPIWHNYGLILYMTHQFKDALKAIDKSLALAPDNPTAQSDRALTLLALGRLQDGLEAYEIRWRNFALSRIWGLNIPEWKGEPLEGRKILVHHEQGMGDSLMLVRFLPELARKHCHITLAVPRELVTLFDKSFPFITVKAMDDETINAAAGFDYHSPLLSVMRWLGISKPEDISNTPYLVAEPKAPMNLPPTSAKIGICWASGNHSPIMAERRRMVPLSLFLPILVHKDISLISLQVGEDAKDIQMQGLEGIVFDPTSKITNFADTASLIGCLDLVISVDSAVAHVAGALGKPCLMLSPYSRCWRWWSKTSGWPWYSRMLIYHQSADGSWDAAMQKAVERALWVVRDIPSSH